MTRPELVDGWRDLRYAWSVIITTIAAFLSAVIAILPPDLYEPAIRHFPVAAFVVFCMIGLARCVKQSSVSAPSPIPAGTVPAKSEYPMAEVSTIAEIIAEAPDFIKVIEDGVAVAQAIESKNFAAVIGNAAGYEADVVKAYNDIKALGVSQAVAAGTVTPAA